jgi:hypothetical protein
MRKMGANLLSQAVFPSSAHLKQALTYMDLATKVELILFELYSNLFWNSALEILIFVIVFILYLVVSGELGAVWVFVLHVIRGIIGILILRGLPLSHEIIKNASIPPDEKMNFDKMFEYLGYAARQALDHFTTKTKTLLKLYFGFSILNLAVDMIMFIDAL